MTVVTDPPRNKAVQGAVWMMVTGFLFVGVTAAVKHGAQDMPAAQSAFLRYVLGIVFLIPMVPAVRRAHLTVRQWKLFTLRGVAHSVGVIFWFYSMTKITIAEVTAMNYMTPIYVTLGAGLILGEHLAFRRLAAVAIAFIGALIILRPGFRELSPGHFAMLGTTIFFAVSYLTAKRMADEVSPSVVVFMLSVLVTVALAPVAYAVWQTPTLAEIGWMFVVAVLATAGHYTMTLAFAAAPVTVTQPVTFLQLVWATLLGWLAFGEALDIWVVFGGVVILGAVTFITLREAILRRQRALLHH